MNFLQSNWLIATLVVFIALITIVVTNSLSDIGGKNETVATKQQSEEQDMDTPESKQRCPFTSTMKTERCLEALLEEKEEEVNELVASLQQSTRFEIETARNGQKKVDTLAHENLLNQLRKYEDEWKSHRDALCHLETAMVTGSGIQEDILRCAIRETNEYLEILEDHRRWFE